MPGLRMSFPSFDIRDVIALARQAGAEIMALRPAVVNNPEIKGDGSPVTLADKRASDIVMQGLAQLTPHIPVISEEAPDAANRAIIATHSKYWIVDPLDGTRSFIDGYDGFGVHIGLIDNGVPVAGVIYFPAQDVLYFTRGGKAYCQDGQAAVREISVRDASATRLPLQVASSWKKHRQPAVADGSIVAAPAVGGARVCVTAQGITDIALIEAPFSYWDIAAAHAVLRAAGGELYELDTGVAIRYPAGSLAIPRAVGGHADVVTRERVRLLDAANALLAANGARKPRP